ncbi:MAG TPA: hypothetical protein VM008_09830 [Phycisphaerae bacterium]|nr:hypothetical protein [Phycisphaerae bacterium]
MLPINLWNLRKQHPELNEVWDGLARLDKVLHKKTYLDVRLLRQTGINNPQLLTAAVMALAATGNYRCVLRVEDPYDHTLQAGSWDRFEDIPKDFVDESERPFKLSDADIVPVLIEEKA